MKRYIYLILSICVLSCKQDMHTDDHTHGAEDAHTHTHEETHAHTASDDHAEEEEIVLNSLQMKRIDLELGAMEKKNLSGTIRANGVVEIPPQNIASVSSLLSGRVQKIHVKMGQYVKKGSILASIQYPELIDWQKELLIAEGELIFLEKEYERQKALLEKEIAARKKFEKVESELRIAQAKKKGLEAKLRMLGLNPQKDRDQLISSLAIRSPISGSVNAINVNTGSITRAQQVLFDILDTHHVHLSLKVFEKDLPFVELGKDIAFSLQSKPAEGMKARVFSIAERMHEEDRSIDVHAEIENEERKLLPGMFVEARIIKETTTVQALPASAISTDKGLEYIFVKEEQIGNETHFRKLAVMTGKKDMGFVEIKALEKMTGKEEIVINGAYYLMAMSKKGEEGAGGHSHDH